MNREWHYKVFHYSPDRNWLLTHSLKGCTPCQPVTDLEICLIHIIVAAYVVLVECRQVTKVRYSPSSHLRRETIPFLKHVFVRNMK
jgi:hypothetical protein